MRLTSRLLLRQYLFWLVSLNTMRLSTIVWKSLYCVNYCIHHASFTETLARVGPTYWALLEEHPWFGLRLPSSYSQLTSARSLCKLSPEDPLSKSCYFFPDTRDQRSLLIPLSKSCYFFPDTRDQRSLLIQLFSKCSRCMRDYFPFLAYISRGRIAFACIRSSRILPYSADWLQRQDICLQLWFLS